MPSGPILDDQRIVIRGGDRDLYNRLDAAIGEDLHIRLAYDGRNLELMTAGYFRERYKELFGSIIGAVMSGLSIDFGTGGQTTWKTKAADRGLQADLCDCFDPEKLRVIREAVARKSRNPADYPVPDLAIEIDVSTPQVDRPGSMRRSSLSRSGASTATRP